MKVKLLIALSALCCLGISNAFLNGISGRWAGTLKDAGDGRDYPLIYTLKADGEKLTGTGLTPQNFEDAITNGTIKGDDFSFDLLVDGKPAKHTGKYIAAGDSVSLNIDFAGRRFHSTLTRSGSPQ